MSAEGKKKRGESGLSNAKNIPFRYGGRPCNYSVRIGGARFHPTGAGSRLVNACRLSLALGYSLSDFLDRTASNAMIRCTSPHLT